MSVETGLDSVLSECLRHLCIKKYIETKSHSSIDKVHITQVKFFDLDKRFKLNVQFTTKHVSLEQGFHDK